MPNTHKKTQKQNCTPKEKPGHKVDRTNGDMMDTHNTNGTDKYYKLAALLEVFTIVIKFDQNSFVIDCGIFWNRVYLLCLGWLN